MFELKGMDNSKNLIFHCQSTHQKDAVICSISSCWPSVYWVLKWFYICNLITKMFYFHHQWIVFRCLLYLNISLFIFPFMSFLYFWTLVFFFSLLIYEDALYIKKINTSLYLCSYIFISNSRILNFSSWTFQKFNFKYFTCLVVPVLNWNIFFPYVFIQYIYFIYYYSHQLLS